MVVISPFCRAWAVILVLLLSACGSHSSEPACEDTRSDADVCQAVGSVCGSLPDNCDVARSCGSCDSGECVAGQCVLSCEDVRSDADVCQAVGSVCGTLPDNCDVDRLCGSCDSGGCVAGQCVPDLCPEYLLPPLATNHGHAGDVPSVLVYMQIESLRYIGHDYFLVNTGNNISAWRIDNPQQPKMDASSSFNMGYFGDRDHNLLRFVTGEDCRFGIAAYESLGIAIFDLGDGEVSAFGYGLSFSPFTKHLDWNVNMAAGVTFMAGGHQFWVGPKPTTGLLSYDAGYLEIAGTTADDITVLVPELTLPDGKTFEAWYGARYQNVLYVGAWSKGVPGFAGIAVIDISQPFAPEVVTASSALGHPRVAFAVTETGLLITAGFAATAGQLLVHDASTSPLSPQLLTNWVTPYEEIEFISAHWPYLYMVSSVDNPSPDPPNRLYFIDLVDMSDMYAPVLIEHDFLNDPAAEHNQELHLGNQYGGVFSPDGTAMYLARYSELQHWGLTCP